MRAVRIHRYGDETVLRLDEVEPPTPGENEVLVAVHATSVNPFDTYVREGRVQPEGGLPHVLGSDAAGVVESVGADVTAFEPGDRVFTTGMGLDRPGTYADYVAVPDDRLAHLPDTVSYLDAAAAAETVTTSLQAMRRGGLTAGDVCVVQGATGGVGHAAVQVARHLDAFVVGTCSHDSMPVASRLGADAVVDYRSTDLATAIREATDGRSVDVVVETHAAANVGTDVSVLAPGGSIVVLGEDDTIEIEKPVAGSAKAKQVTLHFMSHMNARDEHASSLGEAAGLLESGAVEMEVAATFPLEAVADAQRNCVRSGGIGKTLLLVRDGP